MWGRPVQRRRRWRRPAPGGGRPILRRPILGRPILGRSILGRPVRGRSILGRGRGLRLLGSAPDPHFLPRPGGGGGGGGGGHPTRPGSGGGHLARGRAPPGAARSMRSPGRELIRTGGRGGAGARGWVPGLAPPGVPLACRARCRAAIRAPAPAGGRAPAGGAPGPPDPAARVRGLHPGRTGRPPRRGGARRIGLVRLRGLLVVLVVELPTAAHPFMLVQAPGFVQYRPAAPATPSWSSLPWGTVGSCGTSRFPASGCR